MNKVITINLNGRAYQLEEKGFHALQEYLDQADKKLANNPDKIEVMADFEQAIADKCDKVLNGHKSVVFSVEIENIIKEMGPVNDSNDQDTANDEQKTNSSEDSKNEAPKKLFQIREGAMLSGVCNGLAAYLNQDVSLIRVVFVALAIITHGFFVLVYVVMALIIPYANTSEQQAEARGVPFNAQELLQSAKEKYAQFDRKYWKSQKKHIKKYANEQKKNWEKEWHNRAPEFQQYGNLMINVITGIVMGLLSLFWVWAIISMVTTGLLFGTAFGEIPLWVMILIVTCLYNILLMPLRAIKMSGQRLNGYHYDQYASTDGIMWLMIFVVLGWVVWKYVPETHQIWDRFVDWARGVIN